MNEGSESFRIGPMSFKVATMIKKYTAATIRLAKSDLPLPFPCLGASDPKPKFAEGFF